MSLEDKIAALTAAVEANTKVQEAVLAKLNGSPAGKAAAEKPAEKAAEKPADKPAKTTKPKVPSVDELRAVFGAYMGTKDKDEREVRKGIVAKIVEHYGAERATEIAEDKRAAAMADLKTIEDGGKPEWMAEETEEEGEGDDGLI